MRKTLKQRLSEMQKLCRQHDRCKDYRKERSLETKIHRVFMSILHNARFDGVKWTVNRWESNPGYSPDRRWKLEIDASLRSKYGDMPIVAQAAKLYSSGWEQREIRVHFVSVTIQFNPEVMFITFTAKKEAEQRVRRQKILLNMQDYVERIHARVAAAEADLVATQKLVKSMNRWA
jgi:hypothetical protein